MNLNQTPVNFFFNIDNFFSTNYYGDNSQYEVESVHDQYLKDYGFPSMKTDGDEVLAHLLQQEELRRVSIEQSPDLPHSGEKYLRSSYAVPKWLNSSNEYCLAPERGFHEPDDDARSFFCSPHKKSDDGGNGFLDITDETELDGEVENRLHQMNAVPHVPRINGDMPSADEATSDHQRLLSRLQLYDLIEHKVEGDGNCQFRALSDQLYRTPDHHEFVREQVVQQLKTHPKMYDMYVPMDYAEYLEKMSKNGEWGDHVTLKAAADSYGVRITIVTSFKDTCYIEILPIQQKSKRVICLSFWAEVHYNSIYPQREIPPSDFKKKKRWWDFS